MDWSRIWRVMFLCLKRSSCQTEVVPSKGVSVLPHDRHADWCWSHNQWMALHNRSRTVNGMQAWRYTTGSLLCKTRRWRGCRSWESVGPTLKVMCPAEGDASVLCGMPIHIRRHRRHSLCCKCWPDVWEPCQLEHLSQLQFATIDGLHYLCRSRSIGQEIFHEQFEECPEEIFPRSRRMDIRAHAGALG